MRRENLIPEKEDEEQSWGVLPYDPPLSWEGISISSQAASCGADCGFGALLKDPVLCHSMALGFSSLPVPQGQDSSSASPGTSATEVSAAPLYPHIPFLPLLH